LDPELRTRQRKMWASGDYPSMVETFMLPLGPRLVEACGIGPGMRVLDVAAGTGNASIPAAQAGAEVVASDLTPELLAPDEAPGGKRLAGSSNQSGCQPAFG
jgi:2-polyprenyl-3-methyl-5-hydroxy-6-metoxy-1,4-benzoquinol methylase